MWAALKFEFVQYNGTNEAAVLAMLNSSPTSLKYSVREKGGNVLVIYNGDIPVNITMNDYVVSQNGVAAVFSVTQFAAQFSVLA